MAMTINEILRHFKNVSECGNGQYRCLCPAHSDKEPSLSITEGKNGKILLNCFAGCTLEQIIDAAGLTMEDISGSQTKEPDFLRKMDWNFQKNKGNSYRRTAIYDYKSETGEYLYSKVRYDSTDPEKKKQLPYRRLDYKAGRYQTGDGDVPHVLFGLPELVKARKQGAETVFYVEGEKDVLTLRKLGYVATTAGGTKDWNPKFAKYFEGLDVTIFQDNDAEGNKLAHSVAKSLTGVAKRIKIVTTSTKPHGDITDWIEEGHTKEELLQLCKDTPELLPTGDPVGAAGDSDKERNRNTAGLDLSRFHKWRETKSGDYVPTDTKDDVICDDIAEKETFFVLNGQVYHYEHGAFLWDDGGIWAKEIIRQHIYQELITSQRINRIFALLIMRIDVQAKQEEVNQHEETYVCFRDCVYDMRTGQRLEHSPNFRFINQIPFSYADIKEPGADSVTVRFLRSLIPDEADRNLFLEYVGYSLTTSRRFQYLFILRGRGGTGKSVLLRIVCQALGPENYTAFSMQELSGDRARFNTAYLAGKLANICADLPSRALDEIDILKKITGGDPLTGEYKGGKSFMFNPYTKMIFSANRIPKNHDEGTNALPRRLLIIPINNRAEEIENLEERLSDDIASFIWLTLQAGSALFNRGNFIRSEACKQEVISYYIESDHVQAFLREKMQRDPSGKIARADIYSLYEKYCEDEGIKSPYTNRSFFGALRTKGYDTDRKSGDDRYVVGLKQIEDGFISPPEDFNDVIPF